MHPIYLVTVVRNGRNALLETVRSIRPLKAAHVRYFVIDGDSKDGTAEAIQQNSDVVDFWISEPDKGIYDAMNKAVRRIPPGPGHVLFIGAGDTLVSLPDPADLAVESDILFGDVLIGDQRFVSKADWRLRFGNTLHHQGLFIPCRTLFDNPFDTRYRIYADFDLNQRLYRSGNKFRRLDQVIARAQPDGVSWGARRSEVFEICGRNYGYGSNLVSRMLASYHQLKVRTGRTSF